MHPGRDVGGPAGSVAALSLARRGIDSIILERGDDRGEAGGHSALRAAVAQSLGIADALDDHRRARSAIGVGKRVADGCPSVQRLGTDGISTGGARAACH